MHQIVLSLRTPREARAIHQPNPHRPSSAVPPPGEVLTAKADDWGSGAAATVEALKTRQSAVARRVRREVNMVLDVGGGGGCRCVLCESLRARGC